MGLKFAIAGEFWARLFVDVMELVFVGLELGKIWCVARVAVRNKNGKVVGGPLLSDSLGETQGL